MTESDQMKRTYIAAGGAALLLALIMFGTTFAGGNQRSTRWAYIIVVLGKERPLILENEEVKTVIPPDGMPVPVNTGEGPGPRYNIQTKSQRNPEVATLNMLGRDGWEVCASQQVGKLTILTMKRPY